MAESGHTPHMTEDDHTHPMTGAGHTHLTTADGTVQGLRTVTAQDLHHTVTAQDHHTATEDGGRVLMTDLFHHTTEGAIINLYPGHQVLLRGSGAELFS